MCCSNTDGFGLDPRELDKRKSFAGHWWEFTGGISTNILDQIHLCTVNMEWTKADTHLDGTGMEHGVDIRAQAARMAREESLYGFAGLMKVAVVGGLVPTARLRAADERYDGLSQDAWQKGSRLRRQCSTGYGNTPATRRVEFSAQQNNGARKHRNSIKMLVLDARLVTLTQNSNGNLSVAPDVHVK